MNDLIFKQGDFGLDEEGFVHGPLCRRADGLGLYAAKCHWDFHGQPLDGMHKPLKQRWVAPSVPSPLVINRRLEIRPTVEVAMDWRSDLNALSEWMRGYCAGNGHQDIPPGMMSIKDIRNILNTELKDIPHGE